MAMTVKQAMRESKLSLDKPLVDIHLVIFPSSSIVKLFDSLNQVYSYAKDKYIKQFGFDAWSTKLYTIKEYKALIKELGLIHRVKQIDINYLEVSKFE